MVYMLTVVIASSLPHSPIINWEQLWKKKKRSICWVKLRDSSGGEDVARLKWGGNSTGKKEGPSCCGNQHVYWCSGLPQSCKMGFYTFVLRAWLQWNRVQLKLNSSEESMQDDQRIHIHLWACTTSVTSVAVYIHTCRQEKLCVCLCLLQRLPNSSLHH